MELYVCVKSWGVGGVARKVSHHLLYSPCMSSFRSFDVVLDMVGSDTWKWLMILHALFHQENFILAAKHCCTILALATRRWRSGSERYAM